MDDIMENIETQREILNLPEYVFPAALLVFGYPTEQQRNRIKPERSDLRYVVNENYYQRQDTEQLEAMLRVKTRNEDYDSWIKAFCKRKFNSGFSKEILIDFPSPLKLSSLVNID